MGFFCASIKSSIFVSAALSPMPQNLTILEQITSGCRLRSQGYTCSSNMGISSFGGPGRRIMQVFSSSIMMPGAVPLLLYSTLQPSGTNACFQLFSVISCPLFFRNSRISCLALASSTSFLPITSAAVSLVRSSLVGPSPPHRIITSERSFAV